MLTYRACGVEPYGYLLKVLTDLPQRATDDDICDLLPFNIPNGSANDELRTAASTRQARYSAIRRYAFQSRCSMQQVRLNSRLPSVAMQPHPLHTL